MREQLDELAEFMAQNQRAWLEAEGIAENAAEAYMNHEEDDEMGDDFEEMLQLPLEQGERKVSQALRCAPPYPRSTSPPQASPPLSTRSSAGLRTNSTYRRAGLPARGPCRMQSWHITTMGTTSRGLARLVGSFGCARFGCILDKSLILLRPAHSFP